MTDTRADVSTVDDRRLAEPVAPAAILDALVALDVTHVVTVPDTHQKSLLALLAQVPRPRLITACTEDEAFAINAGLFVGGARPILLIQNAGLYASMNSLRGISLDGRVPTCALVGEYLRDPQLPSRDNAARVVHLTEPTLELWGVPYWRLERGADIGVIADAYHAALETSGPSVVLVGAVTGEL
jgi:sulfopyruvate decarboxylase subunit alpha